MTDNEVLATLARRFHRLDGRPLPGPLATEPRLAELGSIEAIRRSALGVLGDPAGSDDTVRALLRAARRDSLALEAALYCLAPRLFAFGQRGSAGRSSEYQADLLGCLVAVIAESDDLTAKTGLADRVTRRARRRCERLYRRSGSGNAAYEIDRAVQSTRRLRGCQPDGVAHAAGQPHAGGDVHDAPLATVGRGVVHDAVDPRPSVEEQAMQRCTIAEWRAAITRAAAAGEIPAQAWSRYWNYVLLPALDATIDRPARAQREQGKRAEAKVKPWLNQWAATHAAAS